MSWCQKFNSSVEIQILQNSQVLCSVCFSLSKDDFLQCQTMRSRTFSHTHALQIKPLFNSFLLSLLSAYMSAFSNVLIIVLCIVLCCQDPFKSVKLLLNGCLTRIIYYTIQWKAAANFWPRCASLV